MLKACIGLNCARQIDFIDRRNCQLHAVPEDVFRYEATLEELNLDSNMIQDLPQVIDGGVGRGEGERESLYDCTKMLSLPLTHTTPE